MEGRVFVFLLARALALALATGLVAPALAAEPAESKDEPAAGQQRVIEPDIERRDIKEPRIDTEDFEVGGYGGRASRTSA
jgi:hypothetical protein